MKKQFVIACLLSLWLLLFAPPVAGQENEAAPPTTGDAESIVVDEADIPPAQEVEINEDNYRQFMELKDPNLQREVIPENVFKPGSGLQKLEKLPEESQKHLRNELREIIVQGDPWQPGDEQGDFPYTPSVAAANNPGLEKQEQEAWGELVDSYNQREAQIHANSAGSRAARGTEDGSGANPGDNQQSNGEGGKEAEGSPAQQAGQQGNPEQPDTTGTYSPNASNDPNAQSTTGVSQNAMEFLQGLGQGGSKTGDGNEADSAEIGGQQGQSLESSGTSAQAHNGPQGGSGQPSAPTGDSTGSAQEPNATSTAGSSQNAMEFLKGNAGQAQSAGEDSANSAAANSAQGDSQADGQQEGQGQATGQDAGQDSGQQDGQAETQGEGQADGEADGQSQDGQQSESEQKPAPTVTPASATPTSSAEPEEESTAGASQNALEYLTGERAQTPDSTDDESDAVQPEGTLTIQDLLNAQGVGNSTGTLPVTAPAEQQPDEDKPDKDGGGQ